MISGEKQEARNALRVDTWTSETTQAKEKSPTWCADRFALRSPHTPSSVFLQSPSRYYSSSSLTSTVGDEHEFYLMDLQSILPLTQHAKGSRLQFTFDRPTSWSPVLPDDPFHQCGQAAANDFSGVIPSNFLV